VTAVSIGGQSARQKEASFAIFAGAKPGLSKPDRKKRHIILRFGPRATI
jgi:hypothetical protein